MPRTDDANIRKNLFKKQSFRSWDQNLFEKLKVSEHYQSNFSVDNSNATLNFDLNETNRGSKIESNKTNQGSLGFKRGMGETNRGSKIELNKTNQGSSGFKNFNQGSKIDLEISKKKLFVDNSLDVKKIDSINEITLIDKEKKETNQGSKIELNKTNQGSSGFKNFNQGSKIELNKTNQGSENDLKNISLSDSTDKLNDTVINLVKQKKDALNEKKRLKAPKKRELFKGKKNVSIEFEISKLRGNEKKLFFFVVYLCIRKNSCFTGDLLSSDVTKAIEISKNSRETCIKRLTKKGLLRRGMGKSGERSTLSFYISEKVKKTADNFQKNEDYLICSNKFQSGFKVPTSSSFIKNTTTKKDSENINSENKLPENWTSLNISPLENIGFSLTQLKQLFETGLCIPEIIQDSIYHFAFGLSYNEKTKGYQQPLNVLMGVLRKGGAWTEKNYEPPQVIAMRELLERKKKEQEILNKLENDLYETGAENWIKKLSDEEKKEIIDQRKIAVGFASKHIPDSVYLKSEYREKFWPLEKKTAYVCND